MVVFVVFYTEMRTSNNQNTVEPIEQTRMVYSSFVEGQKFHYLKLHYDKGIIIQKIKLLVFLSLL